MGLVAGQRLSGIGYTDNVIPSLSYLLVHLLSNKLTPTISSVILEACVCQVPNLKQHTGFCTFQRVVMIVEMFAVLVNQSINVITPTNNKKKDILTSFALQIQRS